MMTYDMVPERREGPINPMPKSPSPSEEWGPRRPESGSPDKDNLMKRMKKSIPNRPNAIDNERANKSVAAPECSWGPDAAAAHLTQRR